MNYQDWIKYRIRLLLAMVPEQRGSVLHEESPPYQTTSIEFLQESLSDPVELAPLIQGTPMP